MLGYRDPQQFLLSVHEAVTGWQKIRHQRRTRTSPSPEDTPATASMYTAPVSGTPPTAGTPGPTIIGFHKFGDRIVPIFGQHADVPEPAANAGRVPDPPAYRSTEPQAPTPASGEAAPSNAAPRQSAPPPPDFTLEAMEASAPPRASKPPPTLDLPPPTPPSFVQRDDHVAMLERVLTEHSAELARQHEMHAAFMQALLADQRRAQAEADSLHRQQLADILARHRDERQTAARNAEEQRETIARLRELLAEHVAAQHAEHLRVLDKIEAITDMVGIVGETVHHIAAVVFTPADPRFIAPPSSQPTSHQAQAEPTQATMPTTPAAETSTPVGPERGHPGASVGMADAAQEPSGQTTVAPPAPASAATTWTQGSAQGYATGSSQPDLAGHTPLHEVGPTPQGCAAKDGQGHGQLDETVGGSDDG